MAHGYTAGPTYQTKLYPGKGAAPQMVTVNQRESVKTVVDQNGDKATFVIPPNGFGADTIRAGQGFVPNFSKVKRKISSFSALQNKNNNADWDLSKLKLSQIDTFSADVGVLEQNKNIDQYHSDASATTRSIIKQFSNGKVIINEEGFRTFRRRMTGAGIPSDRIDSLRRTIGGAKLACCAKSSSGYNGRS